MDATGCGEGNPLQLASAQARIPHLSAAAGWGGVNPTQPRFRLRCAFQLRHRLVRHAVQRVGRVDQILKPGLLLRRTREGFVAPVIAGIQLGRQQGLVADHLHSRLGPLDELAQLLRRRESGWAASAL